MIWLYLCTIALTKKMMRRMCAIVPTPHDAVSDLASVVKVLQNKVIKDCHLYLTMGRGISVNRLVQIID